MSKVFLNLLFDLPDIVIYLHQIEVKNTLYVSPMYENNIFSRTIVEKRP